MVCRVTLPCGGEHHQVGQVVVGADQVADEVDLGGDDVDRRDVDVLAVADDVVVAGPAQHRDALGGRAALADEVDDGLGAVPAGQVEHLLDVVPSATTPWSAPIAAASSSAVGVAVDDDQLGAAAAP